MKIGDENAEQWVRRGSPQGRFEVVEKHLSLALGALKDVGTEGWGHPFDVSLVRLKPGKVNWPRHEHSAQWEYFIILEGVGKVTRGEEHFPISAGDHFMQAPKAPHHIHNTGEEDLVYYLIATNQDTEVVHYPDSNKWGIKPQRIWGKFQEVDYWEGEE